MLKECPCTCKQCTNKTSPKVGAKKSREGEGEEDEEESEDEEGNTDGESSGGARTHPRRGSSASEASTASAVSTSVSVGSTHSGSPRGGESELPNWDEAYIRKGTYPPTSVLVHPRSASARYQPYPNATERARISRSPPTKSRQRVSNTYPPPGAPTNQILIPLGRDKANQRQELLAKTSYAVTRGIIPQF